MRTVTLALPAAALLTAATLTPAPSASAAPTPTALAAASANARTDPAAPWVAGIPISRASTSKKARTHCTAGLPARKGNRTFLITAGHCAKPGETIYTAWTGKGKRRVLGRVTGWSSHYDVAAIETTGDVATTYWSGKTRKPLHGIGTVTIGDKVCHNGFTSRTVCGIRVIGSTTNKDGEVQAIYAKRDRGTAARRGDSGGLVTDNHGRAVGVISGISRNGRTLTWTPAKTALSNWDMSPIG